MPFAGGPRFDAWDLVGVPCYYLCMVVVVLRDFISGHVKSNTHLE